MLRHDILFDSYLFLGNKCIINTIIIESFIAIHSTIVQAALLH